MGVVKKMEGELMDSILKENEMGKLYLCATPIGNLEDITLRVLKVLKEVDLIAAEDTRNTRKLLNHYGINTPLVSYHEHNKKEMGEKLVDFLKQGKSVALVSDAGTPGISDPGAGLVNEVIKDGIPVDILPGPSACISALAVSGLSTRRFVFEGFLPRHKKDREAFLEGIKRDERTIVIYEAPHRLLDCLRSIFKVMGDRDVAVVRELTKLFQEVFRGKISEAIEKFERERPRGEFTLVISGAEDGREEGLKDWEGLAVEEHLLLYMKAGKSKKEAIKLVARDRGIAKREVYDVSVELPCSEKD